MAVRTPHLRFPLELLPDGSFAHVQQDSPRHLADRLIAAALTTIGLRDDDPTFGRPTGVFRAPRIDMDRLRLALRESEPDCAHIIDRIQTPDDLRLDRLLMLIKENG